MATPCDYKKFAVLYVDDEEKSLKYFRLLCGDEFRVLTASNAREGLKLLEQHQHELGVLMAYQFMRGEAGIWLLERAREIQPAIVRLLLSDGCNWQESMAALRSGIARRIVLTPWEPCELEVTIRTELEVFMLRREREQLVNDLRTMLEDRVTSLRILSAGLTSELRDLLQAPRVFVESLPGHLQAKGVNLADFREPEFWQDLYGQVKTQFVRIDEVLKALRLATEEPPLCADRAKLREVIERELGHLKGDLEARQMTVEDFVPDDLPDTAVVPERLQRLFELLLRYKMARLSSPARVQIAARLLESATHVRDQIEITVADTSTDSPETEVQASPVTATSECRLNRTLSSILVYELGGSLDSRKEEGKGTTFVIRLPVSSRAG